MNAPRSDTPASFGISGELTLAAVLLLAAWCVASADLALALVAHTHPIGLGEATRFLVRVLRHRSDPAAAWPVPLRRFSATWFWTVAGLLVAVPGGAVAMLFATLRSKPASSGFAPSADLRRSASLKAARRLAPTTRPSVAATRRDSDALELREVGYPLGRVQGRAAGLRRGAALVASWEHSLELVAPPGSGKTLRVLAPILLQHPGPVLATSTKPDLYEVSATARGRIGPVMALDPERLCPGAAPLRWSPVAGCEDTRVASRRASALVAATGEGGDVRGGGFFRRSATTVLAAYLHAAALEGGTIRDVVSWSSRPGDPAPLRILAGSGDLSVDWSARLHAHTSGAEETTSGVVRTVDLSLACFADPLVLDACSPRPGEEFVPESFVADNGTVFALGKDRGALGGSGPLVTAFCDELIVACEHLAASRPGRRLDPPLLACLDEAPSIAPLPGLPGLVADGRGRGIVVVIAMQSFSQADERWGHAGSRTIRNAASILMVFGGLSVASDLDELSKLSGTRELARTSFSEDERGRTRVSNNFAEGPVLSPSEIHALNDGVALLFFGRLAPVLTYLPGIWEGRGAKALAEEERETKARNDAARHGYGTTAEIEKSEHHQLEEP